MIPLIVLFATILLARLAGQLGIRALREWRASTRVGLAVMFSFTAVAHFNAMRSDLVRMIPSWVPNPEFMVTFTGICEILGAIGILVPQIRLIAGLALVAFLIAVLPANIHAAQAELTIGARPVTPLIPRIAMQILFIVLVWWSSVQEELRRRRK